MFSLAQPTKTASTTSPRQPQRERCSAKMIILCAYGVVSFSCAAADAAQALCIATLRRIQRGKWGA